MLKRIAVLLCVCFALFGKEWPVYRIAVQENIPYLRFYFFYSNVYRNR